MSFLDRLRSLPFIDLVFFFSTSFLVWNLHRYVEPVPKDLFYPSFLLQFAFGFFPQLYQRKWGRVWTSLSAISMVRLPYLSGLPMVGSYQLVGLFLGSIFGIWVRETLLVLLGRNETALPKQSEQIITDWMIRNPTGKSNLQIWYSTYFGFIFFLFCLVILCFLQFQGMGVFTSLGIQEFLYYPNLSSREAMGLSCKILIPIILVVLYFFSEERSMPTPSKDSLSEQIRFGLFLGFGLNILVMCIQSLWSLEFFSLGTHLSVSAGRSTGLFQDSGSASWILPVIGFLWITKLTHIWRKSKERFSLFLLIFSMIIITLLGLKQGKAFWVIWGVFLSLGFIQLTTDLWIVSARNKILTRIGLYAVLPVFGCLILYGISLVSKEWYLVDLAKRVMLFIKSFPTNPGIAFQHLDLVRYELIKIANLGIKENPWMGSGIGSFPLYLLSPSHLNSNSNIPFVDFPPTFYHWILYELGILGTCIFLYYIGIFLWERGLWKQSILLLIPFLFGVQIQNSDGAFVCFYLLFLGEKGTGFSPSFDKYRKTIWFSPLLLILAIGFSLNYTLFDSQKFLEDGIGSEFRKQKLKDYQIAYSIPPKSPNYEYEFHGRVWEWKMSETATLRNGRIFLETRSKSTLVEITFLNADRNRIKSEVFTDTKNGYNWSGEAPKGASYVQIRSRYKLEFRLPRSQFDGYGRLQF
ncbi:hypothetical protein EHQ92_15130 [Leptospira biflexa]|uniref:hypothetical protein n=1 Tax=Leptospira biflexa TaxID=172 RepID=UPI001090E55A|nr:hypothetical protein [Leptospira biflexa]TGM42671.1 hypothetical protein EHQ92_15130 [Leptospira biflexa]TGM45749.1 hypothetical protein EHQ88_12850 [Leptospira biflexa]